MALKMANGEYKDVFNMIETAHKYLYIDEQYYNTLKTALELAAKGCSEHIIRSYIKELDDLESVSDIIADLFEKKHALSNYKTFTLNNLFVEESVYFDWIKVQAKIANAFLTKKIDYEYNITIRLNKLLLIRLMSYNFNKHLVKAL